MNTSFHQRSLAEWLLDLEQRSQQEIQLGLDRISKVAFRHQLHNFSCKVITVAGTNGKGSTVGALEALYCRADYRVGVYTSPHLIQFNERIRINKHPVNDKLLCKALTHIELCRNDIHLSYFEMVTLAAFWIFKQEPLDIIILEVGLGGRLDAVNIIDADLAIITTIDFDHQEFLGNTLDAIGYEKAGILRRSQYFIYADTAPPASIIATAKKLECTTFFFGKEFTINEFDTHWVLSCNGKQISNLPYPRIQLKSAAAALLACELLQETLPISTEYIIGGLKELFIPGRLQLVSAEVSILYDVSHNAQSVKLLAHYLKNCTHYKKIHAVFSALKDKDIQELLIPIKPYITYWYPALLNTNRALSKSELLSHLLKLEIAVQFCYNNPAIAFDRAFEQAAPGDLIVVYGSFYTVGQVMTTQLTRRLNETGT